MKLATFNDGTRDGKLVVVSRDLARCCDASDIAPCLQRALDDWDALAPQLAARAAALEAGTAAGAMPFDQAACHSPLPRAYEWLDGSAYINHVVLVRKARNAEPPATLETDPLMYQGGSGTFLPPRGDIAHFSESYGIDFESEICIITGDVPMGTKAEDAAKYVRLVMICNDVSLRGLIPPELAKGFGFLVSKPSTAFSPVAVTPDELGDAWKDGRLHLPLITKLNDVKYGDPDAGPEMHFSFYQLIQHIAQTRALTAGTIIGSGTVSNKDESRGSSCLAEKRMLETIKHGAPQTSFMRFGDRVAIEMFDTNGQSIFGRIDQKVVQKTL